MYFKVNVSRMARNVLSVAAASVVIMGAVGCSKSGSGGDGSSNGDDSTISGVVVIPFSTSSLSPRRAQARAAGDTCEDVPNGYAPLKNASVTYIDAAGVETKTAITTDTCGAFEAKPSSNIEELSFEAPGYREVVTSVDVFKAKDSKYQIVSTIPTTSSYVISGLTLNADGSLTFVVEDNVTKHAVIGIPEDAFSITENGVDKTFSSITYRAAATLSSETVLTLDASGSMGGYIQDENGTYIKDKNGSNVSRRDLTSLASYDYISSLSTDAKLAITIFDGSVYFYDDTYIDGFSLTDDKGDAVDLKYAADGFEKDRQKSEFVIDVFNHKSSLWGGTKQAAFNYSGTFPSYGGSTAVYEALYKSVDKLDDLNSSNGQYVVLMTDGGDNSSSHTYQEAIDHAKASNVIVNTIGFIGGNNTILEEIANQTGGTFYKATGLDIADAFSAAKAAIDYAYKGVYNTSTASGETVDINLTLTHTGLTVSQGASLLKP